MPDIILYRNPKTFEFSGNTGFNDSSNIVDIINCLILTEKFIKASETNFNALFDDFISGTYPFDDNELSDNYNINIISYTFILYVMMKMDVLRKSTYKQSNYKYKFVNPDDTSKDLEFGPRFHELLAEKNEMKIKDRYNNYYGIIKYELNRMNTLKGVYVGDNEITLNNSYHKFNQLRAKANADFNYSGETYSINFNEHLNQDNNIYSPLSNTFKFYGTNGLGGAQHQVYRIWNDFNTYSYNPDCEFSIDTFSKKNVNFQIFPDTESKNIIIYPIFSISMYCQITNYYNNKNYLLYPNESLVKIKHNDDVIFEKTYNVASNLLWDNDKGYYYKYIQESAINLTVYDDDNLYYEMTLDYSNINFNDLYEYAGLSQNRDYFNMKTRTIGGYPYTYKSTNCNIQFNVGIGGY